MRARYPCEVNHRLHRPCDFGVGIAIADTHQSSEWVNDHELRRVLADRMSEGGKRILGCRAGVDEDREASCAHAPEVTGNFRPLLLQCQIADRPLRGVATEEGLTASDRPG